MNSCSSRRSRSFKALWLALLTVLLVVGYGVSQGQSVPERTFYVAPSGNDANPGTIDRPWATITHAADVLTAGETVYIREGTYSITETIRVRHAGQENAWITYAAFPGERVVIDAQAVKVGLPTGQPPYPHDQGAFQIEDVSYIRVKNLKVMNSHKAGFTVRNSHHVQLYNNSSENSFASGIAVWGNNDGTAHHHQVIGNTVINANAREMLPDGFASDGGETPHEAISIGGVDYFEVAYNLVHDSQKEGIDIKGASKHGTVHHNYVHHVARQGLYVDSWAGILADVEVSHNVVQACKGAGFVISVEGGAAARSIAVHHNLLYDNWGTGILFGRWGNDGLRENIQVYNNTVHHNGYGQPNPGEQFYWITGGIYLFSDHLQSVQIHDNIVSKNSGFQIGYSDRYLQQHSTAAATFQQKQITIDRNLIFGANSSSHPIYTGWAPDNFAHIYGTDGSDSITGDPRFIDPERGNFHLQPDSPAASQSIGVYPPSSKEPLWWQTKFPPEL